MLALNLTFINYQRSCNYNVTSIFLAQVCSCFDTNLCSFALGYVEVLLNKMPQHRLFVDVFAFLLKSVPESLSKICVLS